MFGDGGVSVLNRWDDEICISFQSPLTGNAAAMKIGADLDPFLAITADQIRPID
ncbi:hypothetical protein [Massilia timonae]|uniref:hypothetical protein n=1 Tax=Massilia timonae TaxID=47229 RepID=UPI0002FA67BF|nr:hypothetical protein [Massilia timonae]